MVKRCTFIEDDGSSCERESICKDMCRKHYGRLYQQGRQRPEKQPTWNVLPTQDAIFVLHKRETERLATMKARLTEILDEETRLESEITKAEQDVSGLARLLETIGSR